MRIELIRRSMVEDCGGISVNQVPRYGVVCETVDRTVRGSQRIAYSGEVERIGIISGGRFLS